MRQETPYTVHHVGCCGMPLVWKTGLDRQEARDLVANILCSMRRQGFEIDTLEPGQDWEILEPEDCALIPDEAGRVWIGLGKCSQCNRPFEEDYTGYPSCPYCDDNAYDLED